MRKMKKKHPTIIEEIDYARGVLSRWLHLRRLDEGRVLCEFDELFNVLEQLENARQSAIPGFNVFWSDFESKLESVEDVLPDDQWACFSVDFDAVETGNWASPDDAPATLFTFKQCDSEDFWQRLEAWAAAYATQKR